MLFNIYLKTLLERFEEKNIISLAYADDITLVVKNQQEISVALEILETWAEQYQMKVNKLKSGILQLNQ